MCASAAFLLGYWSAYRFVSTSNEVGVRTRGEIFETPRTSSRSPGQHTDRQGDRLETSSDPSNSDSLRGEVGRSEHDVTLLRKVQAENAHLRVQNTALRKEVDELSRRIISTAFIQDEDEDEDDVLSPIGNRKSSGHFVGGLPPSTPPLPTY